MERMIAPQVFNDLCQAGWAGISSFLDQEQPETLHLEFKQKSHTSKSWNDDDQDAFAKAMSGFANSDGGVVIFGVHARGQKGYPDTVKSISPVEDVMRFRGAIDRCVQQLTDPPVSRVQIHHIINPDEPTKGVVAIYVPQSDAGPHRAARGRAETIDRYYMRTASGTINMHHSLLAAMFGRSAAASLQTSFWYRLSRGRRHIEVLLKNSGRGYAARPAIRFFQLQPTYPSDLRQDILWHLFTPNKGWDGIVMTAEVAGGTGYMVRGDSETVVYPGM